MIPELRAAFNAGFSEEKYQAFVLQLKEAIGCPFEFRLCETPIFLPADLREAMTRSGLELIAQLASPRHQEASRRAVPAAWDVPGEEAHPLFAQVDFAIARDAEGNFVPRLIELQAFPSLYGFQYALGVETQNYVPGGERLEFLLGGLDGDSYKDVLRRAIVGEHDPANVILMDLDPAHQKTIPDFVLTERLWGVRAVCPTEFEREGKRLYYRRDGKKTRVERIYNRLIIDEVLAKGVTLPFRYTEELDVEWAHHPNWYFRWSKHSLPFLDHPTVPRAHFLSDLAELPPDLERYVLKPLFSFAGSGVKVDITAADIARVPAAEREHTLLQEKVEYAPVVPTTDGNVSKVEVRMMYVWNDEFPTPVTTLARFSQGKMMGVDFNKNKTWVGSMTAIWP